MKNTTKPRILIEYYELSTTSWKFEFETSHKLEDVRETDKSYIVRYGAGNVRKILPKRERHGKRITQWCEYYGDSLRYGRKKIAFKLINVA